MFDTKYVANDIMLIDLIITYDWFTEISKPF